jgi:protein-tyrosine phosphatase
MREFETTDGSQLSVPDPYYGGQEGFEAVYQIIERSCRSLLQALEKGEVDIQRRFDL